MEKGRPGNNWFTDVDVVYELYKEHLRNSKECGKESGCFASGCYYWLNGARNQDFDDNENVRKLVLSDGIMLSFYS